MKDHETLLLSFLIFDRQNNYQFMPFALISISLVFNVNDAEMDETENEG